MIYSITPVPAPRMTQSDKWKKRPCVMRYFEFRDKVKDLGIFIPECNSHVTFVMPMTKSWPKKQKAAMDGKRHQNKPDLDNLLKALLDSVYLDDAHIYDYRVTKIWGYEGQIRIEAMNK